MSGDANFNMSSTSLTVGGLTQPGVARSLIEIPSNSEKGLSHRFLWLFPNPLYRKFSTLGEVDGDFILKLGKVVMVGRTKLSPLILLCSKLICEAVEEAL